MKKHFDYIVNKIASAKSTADNLSAGTNHHGLEGQIREIALKECIEPFLTQSFQCSSGQVIDSLQNISNQIDLIVYHRKIAPPILVNKDFGFFPVECVRYVFEIKSTLTATAIKDANEKFESIRKLKSFPKKKEDGSFEGRGLPVTVLFAFGSDITGSEIDRYKKYISNPPPCVALCVLGKGYWFYDGKEWRGKEATPEIHAFSEFCHFISGFMNTLVAEECTIKHFSPGNYVEEN